MLSYTDNYRHKGLRAQLVSSLRQKGIKSEKVLKAIAAIPRHFFLDEAFAEWAYKDTAFPIAAGQTISQPYTVARQSELLNIRWRDKVLEVGTGSGYQACVLNKMGAKVYTIERQEELFKRTAEFLPKIGFNGVRTLMGDGYEGAERFAPFDKILVTAACNIIPKTLVKQLKNGGILVIPVGEGNDQRMMKITKKGEQMEIMEHGTYRFVPMLEGVQAAV